MMAVSGHGYSGDGYSPQPSEETQSKLSNVSKPLSLTTFVPITGRVDKHQQKDEINVTYNVTIFSTFSNSNSSAAFNLNVSTTVENQVLLPKDQDNIVLIVGIVCGVLGLLLGIVLTATFWLYKIKRKPKKTINRSRQASVFEKNPTEKTFEPLNLSLTLPRYEPSHSTDFQRDSSVGSRFDTPVFSNDILRTESDSCHSFGILPSSTNIRRLEKCRTLPSNAEAYEMKAMCLYRSNQRHDLNDFEDVTECDAESSQLPARVYESKNEWEKRQVSVSARGSISSGLGTGTESDVYPFENKSIVFPISKSANENLVCRGSPLFFEQALPINRSEVKKQTRSHGMLSAVVEREDQRKTTPAYQDELCKRKSSSSSLCILTETQSIHECSFEDARCNLVSDPLQNVPSPMLHSTMDQNKCETIEGDLGYDLDVSSVKSTSVEDEDICSYNKDAFTNKEVLSTYFDLHFPSLSLTLNSNVENDQISVNDLETVCQADEKMSDFSDDTINL